MTVERDVTIDILRGLAIFIMLGANLVGGITDINNFPLWFHIYCSIAAPVFITVAGYMAAFNGLRKNYNFEYYLKRGGMILAAGIFIDAAIWRMPPLCTFDVLYLIGFSMPVIYFYNKLNLKVQILLIAAVLLTTALMQKYIPYSAFTFDFNEWKGFSFFTVIKAFLYDGWFPVFPWIAFPMAGAAFAKYRGSLGGLKAFTAGIIIAAAGSAWLYFGYSAKEHFDLLIRRVPYGEIFYPATAAFCIAAFGTVLTLFSVTDKIKKAAALSPLSVLGRTAMFNYIFHCAFISFFILPRFEGSPSGAGTAWAYYGMLVAICLALSYGIVFMKKKFRPKNFVINFIFGG